MHKITVLLFGPPALSQVLKHLFRGRPEFEVLGSISGLKNVGKQAKRLLPELIVASVKPVSTGICQTVTALKNSSPASKLILVCPIPEFAPAARRCGADACLTHEDLVGHLLRKAQYLATPKQAGLGS